MWILGTVLVLVPMGNVDAALVKTLEDSLTTRFDIEVRVVDSVEHPEEAWYEPRKRWRADEILDFLDVMELDEDVTRVTAITEQPISTTKGEHYDWGIAGLGTLDGRSSVMSSYYFRKLKKNQPKKYRRYMENLVLHEVGHTLGLEHCPLERCIMADAKGKALTAAAKSINEFCPRCTRLIADELKTDEVKGEWSAKELDTLEALETSSSDTPSRTPSPAP